MKNEMRSEITSLFWGLNYVVCLSSACLPSTRQANNIAQPKKKIKKNQQQQQVSSLLFIGFHRLTVKCRFVA